MKIIGITGGIGAGKSTVLNLLRESYGAYIVETDKLAHQLMMPGHNAYHEIVKVFGRGILQLDKTIDRSKLGAIVFQDEQALQQLNKIVHPAVKDFILQDIKNKREQGQISYYVIEAALLIEDGYKTICDELWYIYAKQEKRIQRLMAGRGGSREKWEQIIASQSSEQYYREHCNVVIDNGKDIGYTMNVVKDLLS